MIWKLWFKIFLILFLVTLPITLAQYFLQKESIELVFDVVDKTIPDDLLKSHLDLLKTLSKHDPTHSDQYKQEFAKTVEVKIAREDIKAVQDNLVQDILTQTLRNTLIILLAFLVVSFLISKGIVNLLKRLIAENKVHALRLERLNSLESWQRAARVLVHELRAPITPIKLVATDIENKYQALDPSVFDKYLKQGAGLIRTQVSAIERLMESFTKFAKLPEVKKVLVSASAFLENFIRTYRDFAPGRITLQLDSESLDIDKLNFDPELLNQLFFNLLKNACEANPDQEVMVVLTTRQDSKSTWIRLTNRGNLIPENLASRIFELQVSTKTASGSSNFGIGLTISKKIALDHGGDLNLVTNNELEGVAFELELPNL